MTNPTEKIKEIEEEAKRLSKIKKPSKSDIEYHGRLLTKLQVYKEWEAREAKILEMIDELYDYYKTKLDTKAQIPLIKLQQKLKEMKK